MQLKRVSGMVLALMMSLVFIGHSYANEVLQLLIPKENVSSTPKAIPTFELNRSAFKELLVQANDLVYQYKTGASSNQIDVFVPSDEAGQPQNFRIKLSLPYADMRSLNLGVNVEDVSLSPLFLKSLWFENAPNEGDTNITQMLLVSRSGNEISLNIDNAEYHLSFKFENKKYTFSGKETLTLEIRNIFRMGAVIEFRDKGNHLLKSSPNTLAKTTPI